MPIYVSKNDQQLGPFEDAEIRDALRSGIFSYDDWCCREGWEEWKALRTVFSEPHKADLAPLKLPIIKPKRKIWVIAGITIAALVGLYIASPYYALWKLKNALSSGDRASIEALIDFPSLRESLKDQLRVMLSKKVAADSDAKDNPFSGLATVLAPAMVNYFIDNFVTPSGIASLINGSNALQTAEDKGVSDSPTQIDWSKVRHRSFTGLTQFMVDIDGTKIFMSFTGTGWKVNNLELKPE